MVGKTDSIHTVCAKIKEYIKRKRRSDRNALFTALYFGNWGTFSWQRKMKKWLKIWQKLALIDNVKYLYDRFTKEKHCNFFPLYIL